MSIFNIFGNGDNKDKHSPKMNWHLLTEIQQLNLIVETSENKPVIIFKHSTRCSISRFALKQFENEYEFSEEEMQPYFLDLIANRDISNEIANRFEIMHQSPQVLLIIKGKSVYNASHSEIEVSEIKKFLEKTAMD